MLQLDPFYLLRPLTQTRPARTTSSTCLIRSSADSLAPLAALRTALIDADVMSSSIPTPQIWRPLRSTNWTYDAARVVEPLPIECSEYSLTSRSTPKGRRASRREETGPLPVPATVFSTPLSVMMPLKVFLPPSPANE